jgi:hypothetical protein
MLTRESGYPEVAREFWKGYGLISVVLGLYLLVLGGLSLAGVATLLPDAIYLFALSFVGLVTHMSAIFIRDLWIGRIDIDALLQFSSNQNWIQALVLIALLGIYVNTALFGAVYIATLAMGSISAVFVLGIAVYLPVGDLILMRTFGWSPAGLGIRVFAWVLMLLGVLHELGISELPIIGGPPKQPS